MTTEGGRAQDFIPRPGPRRSYQIEVPGVPLSANARRRSTWPRVYGEGQPFKRAALLLARQVHHGPPLERARVTATLVRRGGRALDPDGAPLRCKEILDGLVAGGLLRDDDADHLELVVCQEVSGKGGARCVRLLVEEIGDGDADAAAGTPRALAPDSGGPGGHDDDAAADPEPGTQEETAHGQS